MTNGLSVTKVKVKATLFFFFFLVGLEFEHGFAPALLL
jgi:hypothetical protein